LTPGGTWVGLLKSDAKPGNQKLVDVLLWFPLTVAVAVNLTATQFA
jgi:hypothetical protein